MWWKKEGGGWGKNSENFNAKLNFFMGAFFLVWGKKKANFSTHSWPQLLVSTCNKCEKKRNVKSWLLKAKETKLWGIFCDLKSKETKFWENFDEVFLEVAILLGGGY